MKTVNVKISENRKARTPNLFKDCKVGETYLLELGKGKDIESEGEIAAMRSKASAFATSKGWHSLTQVVTETIKEKDGTETERKIGLYVEFELKKEQASQGQTNQNQNQNQNENTQNSQESQTSSENKGEAQATEKAAA